jgi:predicted anti-sigma-YlaC factor YlaD
MTTPGTNTPVCRDIEPALSLLVDGRLSARAEEQVRAHLGGCPSCRGLLADLDRLRRAARQAGGPITPPPHLWLQVAGQIRRDVPEAAPARPRRSQPVWQWTGLAAALVLVTLGIYVVQRLPGDATAPTAADNAAPAGSVQVIAGELNLAVEHYERALAELEALAQTSQTPMDDAVAGELRASLKLIDQAIAESRAALASNPQSEPAQASLFDALRRKVEVLQTTVALINEMRLGDPQGAQRAAETLGNKS